MNNSREDVLINTDKRLFYISNDINNETIGKICFNLLYILQEDDIKEEKEKNFIREPIKIFINSYGGSADDMWALIDIMIKSRSPIYTYCTGYAMSAGFLIFLAGSKRFISEHCKLLYHQISCWRLGKYQDLVEDRKEMDHYQDEIEKYVLRRTKISSDKLKDVRERKIDWYIHMDDAIYLGIATNMIEFIV